ncbi:MAG: helix-turn-helix domain-containing protein [Synergistes sp.]|nr:helix-turn-helix domain-containing protein [Synergistes sp.]
MSKLKARAAGSGIDLERSREIIAISFPDFRKAELGKNPQKITYGDNSGSNESETDSSVMTGRIIMLLREIFQDPGTIISNVSNDRFVVIRPIDLDSYSLTEDESYEGGSAAVEILRKLDEYRLNAVIGVGRPARGFSDLPAAYSDAWKIVSLSQRIGLPPGVYHFDNLMLESLLLSVKNDFVFDCVGKKTDALGEDDSGDLRTTFKVYCESFFNKQKAAERLHLHRNTLAYRLQKIEERLGVPLNDFKSVLACYLILRAKELQVKQQSE